MLPKRARLRASEVTWVLKKGKSVRMSSAPHLSMKFIVEPGAFRAAVVVSKSVARGAPARNRIRRVLYQALREIPTPRSAHAIFFVQKIPSPPLAPTLRLEAEALIKKLV